jgi:hypothetical protein
VVRNPLDPFAYDTEIRPFTPSHGVVSHEAQRGIHTTPNELRAAVYAIQRAKVTNADEPNCAVIFELDTAGLDPLPDVDAMIEAKHGNWIVGELLSVSEIAEALAEGDAEALAEAMNDYAENTESFAEGWPADEWLSMAWYITEQYEQSSLPYVLRDMEPEELLSVMQEAQATGALPLEVWADVNEQYRYLTPIGLDRVRRIIAIRPVRDALWGHDEDDPEGALQGEEFPPEDDESGPQIMSEEDFFEGSWMPDQVVLWENRQLPLFSGEEPRIEYHGTDLTRARSAFQELPELQESPWPYTQD